MGFGLTKNKQKAIEWNTFIANKYSQETQQGIMVSSLFDDTNVKLNLVNMPTTNVTLIEGTTIDAISKAQGVVTILNFASYFQAGGGYIKGCMAQEESLCHTSNLWQILSSNKIQQAFYEVNKQEYMYNNYLFRNRAVYSPLVVFPNQNRVCGVITCAAPDLRKIMITEPNYEQIVTNTIQDRIRFVMSLSYLTNANTLILGAFGCGVFRNDPRVVAKTFVYFLKQMHFDNVIFAIPKGNNYNVFHQILRENNYLK